MTSSYTYRKLYEQNFGPIPKDEDGRTYEIHHKDGNRANNDPNNLSALSIREHYNVHYKQGDYGACVLIARRMSLPPDHISTIQKGVKRPGVGGVKKGTPSKFKGIKRGKINVSEEGRLAQSISRKKNNKISDEEARQIRDMYDTKISIDDEKIGKVMRNGRVYPYERAFARHFSKTYNVSEQYIYSIIKGKSKVV